MPNPPATAASRGADLDELPLAGRQAVRALDSHQVALLEHRACSLSHVVEDLLEPAAPSRPRPARQRSEQALGRGVAGADAVREQLETSAAGS